MTKQSAIKKLHKMNAMVQNELSLAQTTTKQLVINKLHKVNPMVQDKVDQPYFMPYLLRIKLNTLLIT